MQKRGDGRDAVLRFIFVFLIVLAIFIVLTAVSNFILGNYGEVFGIDQADREKGIFNLVFGIFGDDEEIVQTSPTSDGVCRAVVWRDLGD